MRDSPTREQIAAAVKEAFARYMVEYEKYFQGTRDSLPQAQSISNIRTALLRIMGLVDSGCTISHIDLPLREYLLDMVVRGRLLPFFTSSGAFKGSNDDFHLTPYGYQCWKADVDTLPIDRDSIVEKCRANFPGIDTVTIEYLKEGATAIASDLYLAAAVCLGASSESEILNLIDYFCNSSDDSGKIKAKFEKKFHISEKERHLDKMLEDNKCPEDLREDLDRLESLCRESRNKAGHPRIMEKDETTIRLLYLMFARYMKSIAAIRQWIDDTFGSK